MRGADFRGMRVAIGSLLAAAAVLMAASPAAAFEPLGQRGTGVSGDAAGQLSSPYQPAVDSQGNLFVGDSQNARISEFAPDGSFIKAFGKDVGGVGVDVCITTCQVGTNDGTSGSMCFPDGLAIDPVTGDLVVGDECNNRIEFYRPDGTFLQAFGQDVGGAGTTVCSSSCEPGADGDGPGAFDTPVEIAIDQAGTIFVGDEQNNRVDVFTLTGGFQRAFGADVGGPDIDTCTTTCVGGTGGGAAGDLNAPSGVALDGAGNIFVGEENNDRVSVFTVSGTFKRAFGGDVGGAGVDVCTVSCVAGSSGTGDAGELNEPFELGFDPFTGHVLVPEFEGKRVSEFTPAGAFVRTFGRDVDQGDGTGFEICTSLCQLGLTSGAPGGFNEPSGVVVDCRGTVYVSDDSGARAQLFGEPGAQPCGSAPPPPAVKPSNAFGFGRLHRNKKKGTAILEVNLPGPGAITTGGGNAKIRQLGAGAAANTVILLIKGRGKAKRKLRSSGRAKVSVLVTFTPDGGDPASQSRRIKLIRRR